MGKVFANAVKRGSITINEVPPRYLDEVRIILGV